MKVGIWFAIFKFGFIVEARGTRRMRQRELLKKFPLDSLKTFGKSFEFSEGWRTPIKVK